MSIFSCFTLLILSIFRLSKCQTDCEAFGVSLSLGDYFQRYVNNNNYQLFDNSSSNVLLRINYFTNNTCPTSYVIIGGKNLTSSRTLPFNSKVIDNSSNISFYIQIVDITTNLNLPVNADIYYTIHSNNTASDVPKAFRLRIPDRDNGEHTLIVVGDMDTNSKESNATFYALQNMANQPKQNIISAVLYTGNMAYNLESNTFLNGLNFFKKLQVFCAFWPIMATAGTRESSGNYSFFHYSFTGINDNLFSGNFFSYNMGKAHIVQINMALLFDVNTSASLRNQYYTWLEGDLQNANTSSNRKARPWIIVYGYHSFYCSYQDDIFCGTHSNSSITQLASVFDKFEDIFSRYLVDLYISSANTLIYERLPPIKSKKKMSYTSLISPDVNQLYMVNPTATVYLVEGLGGTVNTTDNKFDQKLGFTLVQSKSPGYGKLTIYNGTHILYQHLSSDGSADTDTFYLINTKSKWPEFWEETDKKTFIASVVCFVIIGSAILIAFMLSLE